ncbi:hypothetical protein EFK50_13220 [Nocardioides marmoriginsengisoli]|uniref:Uncharacterized protein n=1 Tax=Nocardioides marmoriginsengisoli TaxID=661483 RepID=A0A3N0CGY7_9ACTN|nr:hypothetical protein EFK50_13220 [Nocardioides marmoriginsengisoli]
MMGEQIQRFRHATLLWCHQATEASAPKFIATLEDRGPARNLRYQLGETVRSIAVPLPTINEIASRHPNALVETWRQAAAASALGEHDFGADIDHTRLDGDESRAVLKDAADIARGLVILDRRYSNVPGWVHFKNPGRLERAAEACSQFAAEQPPNFSVDARGWHPQPAAIEGPALPGMAGVLQAQHNMLIDLSRFPNALNLRRILHSQIGMTHEAAGHAESAAPGLVDRFRDREYTYKLLQRSSRNLGGLVGDGGLACSESENAHARLKSLPMSEPKDAPSLHQLARHFARTDARVASTLERGFAENLYFVSVKYPRLGDQTLAGVVQQRQRWVPVTSPVQTDLIPLVRERLRSVALVGAISSENLESRLSYETVLAQQPGCDSERAPRR